MINWVILVGLVAAICTTGSFIPQVVKALKSKDTRSLSFEMYLLLFIGISLWLIYGFLVNDIVIIIANTITFFLTGLLLFLIRKYG